MSKKLEGNGLWGSSRIIIPEHKEAYLKLMKDRQRRGKPEIDDQEVQLIEQALIESYNTRQPVTLVVFSPFDDEELTGVITSINTARREVKLFRGEDDFSWIKLEDIISASI
ncbi:MULTISPECIES: YolD-like family protein [Paenibacillus]|uniref:YolD-like family protein n=2 Tax=Paenibacillus TaxID=44249 RepID=A0A7H0Y4B1_9BACL|nr:MULTISPECIES: YolD-like family protein [Paenibacillus]PNQ78098.1 YolD-like family protein [Paenibacillus sp. F4]QNR65919.1 YolD-like family protein [Paenibacillus peoriae]